MWGKAHTDVRERVEHVGDLGEVDPFADLQPVEKLKKTSLVEHPGSVNQVVVEPEAQEEPEPLSQNAKYWPKPRLNLSVARRFVAMVMTLSLFAAASGGMIVSWDLWRLVG